MTVSFIDVISVASSTPRHEQGSNFQQKHHRKIKTINNTDPTKNRKWTHVLEKGKKLLFLIRNPQSKITKHLYFAKLWIQINTKQVRGYIVYWLFGCLHRYMISVSYLLHVGGCLQGCVLYVLFEAAWWLSVSYMRQDDRYLSVTWGRMKDICQLHEAALSLYVS